MFGEWGGGGVLRAGKRVATGAFAGTYRPSVPPHLLSSSARLVAARILEEIYNEDGTQNKWWMQYAKMSFMGVKMTSDGDVI